MESNVKIDSKSIDFAQRRNKNKMTKQAQYKK